jgi:hypothetical protein
MRPGSQIKWSEMNLQARDAARKYGTTIVARTAEDNQGVSRRKRSGDGCRHLWKDHASQFPPLCYHYFHSYEYITKMLAKRGSRLAEPRETFLAYLGLAFR